MIFETESFGCRVKFLRQSKGITQEKMADDLSITLSYLGKLETGNRKPSIDFAVQLALYLGISLDYLVYGQFQSDQTIEEMALSLSDALKVFAARKLTENTHNQ